MDGSYSARSQGQATNPPLDPLASMGVLHYADGTPGTAVRPEISGNIDKGFFLSDGEWTCYRRNYFSCVCSFSLSPHYPNMSLHFTLSTSQQTYTVQGFAMSISAVVADNDGHSIELVQHTPKRDKGPIMKPEKVRMVPKVSQTPHHPLSVYGHGDGGLSTRGYDPTYVGAAGSQGAGPYQTEHTFERIQFKQATANNGKRRAAQQYYHLVVELYADVGSPNSEQLVRVAEVGENDSARTVSGPLPDGAKGEHQQRAGRWKREPGRLWEWPDDWGGFPLGRSDAGGWLRRGLRGPGAGDAALWRTPPPSPRLAHRGNDIARGRKGH